MAGATPFQGEIELWLALIPQTAGGQPGDGNRPAPAVVRGRTGRVGRRTQRAGSVTEWQLSEAGGVTKRVGEGRREVEMREKKKEKA